MTRLGEEVSNSDVIPALGVIPNLIGNPGLDSRFRGNDTERIGNDTLVISTEAKRKEKSLKDGHDEGIPRHARNDKRI